MQELWDFQPPPPQPNQGSALDPPKKGGLQGPQTSAEFGNDL